MSSLSRRRRSYVAKPRRSRRPSEVEDAARCVSDIVGAVEARRSVLAPPRSDAIGRSARALARSINASLRCISGVLSCLYALRRRSCNSIVRGWWTLPKRTCNGRVDSVSRSDSSKTRHSSRSRGGRDLKPLNYHHCRDHQSRRPSGPRVVKPAWSARALQATRRSRYIEPGIGSERRAQIESGKWLSQLVKSSVFDQTL